MKQLSEIELLLQLKEGRESAFELIYEKYWRQLYLIAYKRIRERAIAEDLVHDVLLDIWQRRHTLNIHTSLNAYLMQAMKYAVLNSIRSMKHQGNFIENMIPRLQYSSHSPDKFIEHKETEKMLMNKIDQLPKKCREVFKMSRFDHLSYQKIADKLSISPKTVENQISKAIKVLKLSFENTIVLILVYILEKF